MNSNLQQTEKSGQPKTSSSCSTSQSPDYAYRKNVEKRRMKAIKDINVHMKRHLRPKITLINESMTKTKNKTNHYRRMLEINRWILKIVDNKKNPLHSDKQKLDVIKKRLHQDSIVKTRFHRMDHIK